jgi:mono/diheme cytochrome c family protein
MRGCAAAVALLLWGSLASLSERQEAAEKAAEFRIPAEEVSRQNPTKSTSTSIALGKKIYGFDCAMCHGKDGDGKGDLADSMGLKLRDYRDPATLKDLTDGELYYLLTKGKGKMPGDEDRMKPEQRWNLINYLRSLAKKTPSAPAKP